MSRSYVPADLPAVQRMWRECGWIESDDQAKLLEDVFAEADVLVAELNGEVECVTSTHRGTMMYDGSELDLLAVTAVTTSWVGRKQGLATSVTADALAAGAAAGAEVAALGVFEQGFYDQLGFGNGVYEHQVRFDPASIEVAADYRPPIRLTADDYEEVAAAHARRLRGHGGITIAAPRFYRAEITWNPPLVALGYRNDAGRLTHFVVGRAKGEAGPYRVDLVSYETIDQLVELMALLKSLGDQVRSMVMLQPPHLQLEDLLRHPVRARISTKGSEFEATNRAMAWWQVRILDLGACIARRRWRGPPVRFNLRLTDPMTDRVDHGWGGIGGSYVVEIGEPSSVDRGEESGLPTVEAGVGAFSRLWLGCQPASTLCAVDDLEAPDEIVAALDAAMRLPTPHPGMYF